MRWVTAALCPAEIGETSPKWVMFSAAGQVRLGPVKVTLELYRGRPVTGRLYADGAEPVAFTGWLTLMALLENLVEDEPAGACRPLDRKPRSSH